MKNCWVHVANGGIGINNLEKMLFCYIIELEKIRDDLIIGKVVFIAIYETTLSFFVRSDEFE